MAGISWVSIADIRLQLWYSSIGVIEFHALYNSHLTATVNMLNFIRENIFTAKVPLQIIKN